MTRARVSALTERLPDSARDTVGCETPASAAISNEVGRRWFTRKILWLLAHLPPVSVADEPRFEPWAGR